MDSVKRVPVDLQLQGDGSISGTWEVDDIQQRAAWELYVELVTRISVIELKPQEGLLREALSSLYSIFDSTRGILRQYGPEVARPKNGSNLSFGYMSVTMLNSVVRPVLAKWHPLLLDYESMRHDRMSPLEHERYWDRSQELRHVLQMLRHDLTQYAEVFSLAADTPLSDGMQNGLSDHNTSV